MILKIDSPGGTTVGGESTYEAVRKIAAVKPVAAEVGTLAASAGYMIAVGCRSHRRAPAPRSSGRSASCFSMSTPASLLDTIGVEVDAIKSSPMKAEPSPFGPAPQEAKDMIRRLILDTYDWFVALVAERRGFTDRGGACAGRRLGVLGPPGSRQPADRRGRRRRRRSATGWRTGVASKRGWRSSIESREKDGFGWGAFSSARSMLFPRLSGSMQTHHRCLRRCLRKAGHLDGLVSALAAFVVTNFKARSTVFGPPYRGPMPALGRVGDRCRTIGRGRALRRSCIDRGCNGRPVEEIAVRDDDPVREGNRLIKSELVAAIASRNPHLYQRHVEMIVNAIFDEITDALCGSNRVELRGFGAFSVKNRPPRSGRNPRTGEAVEVEEKWVPFFKAGKELRETAERQGLRAREARAARRNAFEGVRTKGRRDGDVPGIRSIAGSPTRDAICRRHSVDPT